LGKQTDAIQKQKCNKRGSHKLGFYSQDLGVLTGTRIIAQQVIQFL